MAKYVPLISPDKKHVVMMKTTVASPGNTDWDSIDGSVLVNRLGHSDQNLIASMWAFEHDSDIYVATQQDYGRVALHIFDPGTDAWTVADESAGVAGEHTPATTEISAVSLSVRSDGDVLIAFKDAAGDRDNLWTRRESGVWTGATFEAPREGAFILTPPSSIDSIYFINQYRTAADVRIKKISSSNNTSGTNYNIDPTVLQKDYIIGNAVITEDVGYVPYIDLNGSVGVGKWDFEGPINISIVNATSNDVDSSTDGPLKLGLTLDGTDRHLFYIRDTDDDIYHDQDTGSGWGTDTQEITGTGAITALSANKLTTDIGIIYDDNGTTKFGVYTLDTPSSVIYNPARLMNNFLVR